VPDDAISALSDLGFTALEAEIYAFLVREAPATGYRVAQALGKAAANVYKAIESLERKGALLVDDAEARLCRPVPIGELLARLERRFQEQRARAERAVDAISTDSGDDRVYRLGSKDQVVERARAMIDSATHVVLVDVFPSLFPHVADALQSAAARGVDVAVLLYAPGDVPGAEVTVHEIAEKVLAGWPGDQLNVVADAAGSLLALLERNGDRVLQAVWSESAYLSCLMHSMYAADLLTHTLAVQLEAGASADTLARTMANRRGITSTEIPGYHALLARYGEQMHALKENKP